MTGSRWGLTDGLHRGHHPPLRHAVHRVLLWYRPLVPSWSPWWKVSMRTNPGRRSGPAHTDGHGLDGRHASHRPPSRLPQNLARRVPQWSHEPASRLNPRWKRVPRTSLKLSLPAPAAHGRWPVGRCRDEAHARARSAVQRPGPLRDGPGGQRLERTRDRRVAAAGRGRRFDTGFRQASSLDGRGRHHPLHEHAGRAVSPRTQFLITGVLGPGSNAHGPNEFLNIGYAKKLSLAVASVVASIGQG